MLLKINNFKNQNFAIGLRWVLATRSEIDFIKENERLDYGFVTNPKEQKDSKYRIAALSDQEHSRAISLAGLCAEKFENLVFVHKIREDRYWICIIRNHEVWNDIDLGEKTAGDYVCNEEQIHKIISIAQDQFLDYEIKFSEIAFCNQKAKEDFPELQVIEYEDLLKNTQRYNKKFKITLLQNYRKSLNRLFIFISILCVVLIGTYYLYETQNAQARSRAQALQKQIAAERAAQARLNFISQLKRTIHEQQGSHAIDQFLNLVGVLSIQSAGWTITHIEYNVQQVNILSVKLQRGPYGDILSFRNSYQASTVSEQIEPDNNSGTKVLKLNIQSHSSPLTPEESKILDKIFSNQQPLERFQLIAYGQRLNLNLQTMEMHKDQYGNLISEFSVSGNGIWNLRKMQFILQEFPTAMIDEITVDISSDNKMSWIMKGKIYG